MAAVSMCATNANNDTWCRIQFLRTLWWFIIRESFDLDHLLDHLLAHIGHRLGASLLLITTSKLDCREAVLYIITGMRTVVVDRVIKTNFAYASQEVAATVFYLLRDFCVISFWLKLVFVYCFSLRGLPPLKERVWASSGKMILGFTIVKSYHIGTNQQWK